MDSEYFEEIGDFFKPKLSKGVHEALEKLEPQAPPSFWDDEDYDDQDRAMLDHDDVVIEASYSEDFNGATVTLKLEETFKNYREYLADGRSIRFWTYLIDAKDFDARCEFETYHGYEKSGNTIFQDDFTGDEKAFHAWFAAVTQTAVV